MDFVSSGFPTSTAGPAQTKIDVYLDLTCPFSKKSFVRVMELTKRSAELPLPVQFHIYQIPQPWHPQSTTLHQVALATLEVAPAQYLQVLGVLFERQTDFFDVFCWNTTRDELIDKVIGTIGDVLDEKQRASVKHLCSMNKELEKEGQQNVGSRIDKVFKAVVKHHRKAGVHVSPTVFCNGQEAEQVSSGWDFAQWVDFLRSKKE